jgi:hypothetical protein
MVSGGGALGTWVTAVILDRVVVTEDLVSDVVEVLSFVSCSPGGAGLCTA